MEVQASIEARLYLDQDRREPELLSVAGGVVAVYSARCPGKETPNEDAVAVLPVDGKSAVLVVADGLGGTTAGERASALALKQLRRSISSSGNDGMLRTTILNGIEQANRAVSDLGVGAGTRLAIVEISGGMIRSYHVGDSMILAVGQRGKVKLQTVSHSPVGYAVEAGMLNETEAIDSLARRAKRARRYADPRQHPHLPRVFECVAKAHEGFRRTLPCPARLERQHESRD
jgi:serine/threonine protein phosphatase PrpC